MSSLYYPEFSLFKTAIATCIEEANGIETKYAVITEEDKQKLQEQTELNLSQNYNINLASL